MGSTKKPIKTNRKKIIALVLLALLFAIILLVFLEKSNTIDLFKAGPQTTQSGPTPEQKAEEAKINSDNKQKLIENETAPTSPASNNSSVSVSARQETDNTVTILTKLEGYSSGTCELKITNSTKSITRNAEIIYQPEFSICAGYTVPISELGKGNWEITLSVVSSAGTSEKKIIFEVK